MEINLPNDLSEEEYKMILKAMSTYERGSISRKESLKEKLHRIFG